MGWEDEVNHFYLTNTGLAFTLQTKPKGKTIVSSTDGLCGVISLISNFRIYDPKKSRMLEGDDFDAQVHVVDALIASFNQLPVPAELLRGYSIIDNATRSPPEYDVASCCAEVDLVHSGTGLIKVCRGCARLHTPHNMGVLTTVMEYICNELIDPRIPVTNADNI